jgi:hypothetical protein
MTGEEPQERTLSTYRTSVYEIVANTWTAMKL